MAQTYYPHLPGKLLAIGLLLAFGMFMPLIVVPPIEDVLGKEFAIAHAQTALLYSLPVAMLALVAIPSGFLGDRIGLKKVLGIGAVVMTVGSALRGVTNSYPVALAFTLVYGLGLGLCFPNVPKLARHCSLRERSHFTVSLFTAGILASGAVALSITRPWLLPITNSSKGVFLVSAAPVFLAAVLWWFFVSDPPCEASGVEAVGVDSAALRKVIARRDLWLVAVLFFLHNFVLYTFVGWLPGYLVSIGAGAKISGLITSVTFWAGLLSVLILSEVSTRLGRRKPFLWAPTLLLILAMYGVLYINVPASWVLVFFSGIATTIRFATILNLPVEMVGPGLGGSASGLVMSIGYIGALVGPLLGGIFLDRTGSYRWIFLSMAIVSVVTLVFAFLVPETLKKKEK